MQKWEYCAVVGLIKGRTNPETFHPAVWYFTEKGVMMDQFKGQELMELASKVASLGEQGWELVGVVHIFERYPASFMNMAVGNSTALLFKRPKE